MAVQLHVTNANATGVGSLADALRAAAANPGSTIVFDPALGGATITGALPAITQDVTIDGSAAPGLVIDFAGGPGFLVPAGVVAITNLTVANAAVVGAAGASGTAVSPRGGGAGDGVGGALSIGAGAVVTLSGVGFSGNTATGGTGGGSFGSGGDSGGGATDGGGGLDLQPGGTDGLGGGGGMGAGGAIHVAPGGSLLFGPGSASLTGDTAAGGVGGPGAGSGVAASGAAAGGDLFIASTQTITLDPGAGNTLTFAGTIADQAGSNAGQGVGTLAIRSGTVELANGGDTISGGITIAAGATLQLDATGAQGGGPIGGAGALATAGRVALSDGNDGYAGGTTIVSGSLELGTPGAAGAGAITFGAGTRLTLDAAALPSGIFANVLNDFAIGDTIDLAGVSGAALTAFDSASGTLSILDAPGTAVASLTLGSGPAVSFAVAADGTGGTLLTAGANPVVTRAAGPIANNAGPAVLGSATASPFDPNDPITVALTADSVFATGSMIALGSDGTTLFYTPGAVTAAQVGPDTLAYTVTDTVTGTTTAATQVVTLDNGPAPSVLAAGNPFASNTQPATLGTATAGSVGGAITVALTADAAFATGSSLTLASDGASLLYRPGPVTLANAGADSIAYAVTDTRTGAVTNQTQSVQLTPAILTTLASLDPGNAYPESGVIVDAAGTLYGTAANGTVFKLAKAAAAVATLASFSGPDGAFPIGSLVADAAGTLYGTTLRGGASGNGTVFAIAPGASAPTTLASFAGADGASPYAGLLLDAAGNLFGTTAAGGASGNGAVFELARGAAAVTVLASFTGADGASPLAGLVADAAGTLYGATYAGGASGVGTIFELPAGARAVTTVASFSGVDGSYPFGKLVLDAAGNLFGTTAYGGPAGDGTVFEIAAGAHAATTLASFSGTNGATPEGGLLLDTAGTLFGVTANGGGAGDGTVFALRQGDASVVTLATFDGANGQSPMFETLAADASGTLYGTAAFGGSHGRGTIFALGGSGFAGAAVTPTALVPTTTTLAAGQITVQGHALGDPAQLDGGFGRGGSQGLMGAGDDTFAQALPAGAVSQTQGGQSIARPGGSGTLHLTGWNNVVTGGAGDHTVDGAEGGSTVTLGDGYQHVSLAGWGNSVTIGNNADADGSGQVSTVDAGYGNSTVAAGDGANVILAGGWSNTVTVGTGVNAIFGRAASGGALAGDAATAGNDTVNLGGGRGTVFLSGWGNVVHAAGGVDAIRGGLGNDRFSIDQSGGMTFITGVSATNGDALDLSGLFHSTSKAAALASLTVTDSIMPSLFIGTGVVSGALIAIATPAGASSVFLQDLSADTVRDMLDQGSVRV